MNLGWLPDIPDQRDHVFAVGKPAPLPALVDLRAKMPPVYDQGDLGSCTANAIAAAFEYEQVRQKMADFMPSRLFIYYNERVIEHTVDSDAGAMIRDGIKSVNQAGVCSEQEWPYKISEFATPPGVKVYQDAKFHRSVQYQRVPQSLQATRQCLASGCPIVFGFTCYESFESSDVAKTGVLNLPGHGEQMIGGHAVLAVGYSDLTQRFLVRNSWGTSWGMVGYFTMPYTYLLDSNLADDLWAIQLVGGLQ